MSITKHIIEHSILGNQSSAPIVGGSLTVKDEGIQLSGLIRKLNFIGADIIAQVDPTDSTQVNIFSPSVTMVPYYNSTNANGNATVIPITTSSRVLSAPVAANFPIGTWAPGTLVPCINTPIITLATTSPCLFDTLTSTIKVEVFDSTGTGLLDTLTSPLISNIMTYGNSGEVIKISVTDWSIEAIVKRKANIRVDINIGSLLVFGGRFSIKITHQDVVSSTFTQGPIFYDADITQAAIVGTPTIVENISVIKPISGVKHYNIGSTFNVNVPGINNINNCSFPTEVLRVIGTNYGLPTLLVPYASLTGWSPEYNKSGLSYSNSSWAITATNYYAILSAIVQAQTIDWTSGTLKNSTGNPILVETHNTPSTDTSEYFYNEGYRCPLTGNFDLANQRSWVSANPVSTSDAVFHNGKCGRRAIDFRSYSPNAINQPNYTTLASEVTLIREYKHNGSASSGARIYITGAYNTLKVKLAKTFIDGDPSGGTTWLDCTKAYNGADWNNGSPLNGTGCMTGSGAGYIDITFGTNNIINCNNTMYLSVSFINSQEINGPLNIVFN